MKLKLDGDLEELMDEIEEALNMIPEGTEKGRALLQAVALKITLIKCQEMRGARN